VSVPTGIIASEHQTDQHNSITDPEHPNSRLQEGQYEISVPVLMDRCHQARVRNALEPEWEAKFEARSYGFRPGRGCADAIGSLYSILKGPGAQRVGFSTPICRPRSIGSIMSGCSMRSATSPLGE